MTKSYLTNNTGSTYYDLQKENGEIKEILQLSYGNFIPLDEYQKLKQENKNLKLQLKGTTHCYDEHELKAFKKKINDIVEYCRTTQMTLEEFIELKKIAEE